MNISCCYRLIPKGEIIHSTYDTETCSIIGIPRLWFPDYELKLGGYDPSRYHDDSEDFGNACEVILTSNDNYAIVVESNKFGFYAYGFDGSRSFLTGPYDNYYDILEWHMPDCSKFEFIGYRRTQYRQYQYMPGLFRMTYYMYDGLIYTNDGALQPQFDILSLNTPRTDYAGYKTVMTDGHYGVVYQNNNPRFVQKIDNKLILV